MNFVLDWHASERFRDAYPLDEDGDGVLIQWGTYAWDASRTFQFDVTRQLTTAEGWFARLVRRRTDDVSLWQVHVTLHYSAELETDGVEGSLWVFGPNDAAAARTEVTKRGVFDLLSGRTPLRVEVSFEQA